MPSSSVELSFSKSWRTPSKRTDSWRATFRDAGVAVEDHWLRRVLKWGNHGKMMMKYIKVGKIGTYFLEQTSGKMLMIFDYPRANVQKETRKNYHAFPFSNSTSSQNSTSSAGMIFPIAPGNGFSWPPGSTLWKSEKNWIQLDGWDHCSLWLRISVGIITGWWKAINILRVEDRRFRRRNLQGPRSGGPKKTVVSCHWSLE